MRTKAVLLSAVAGASLMLGAEVAAALPTGAVVSAQSGGGGASVSTSGSTLTVNQSSTRVVIDWRSFNLSKGETVSFVQPGAGSIAFNRIASAANIDGQITANGGVWLFSPNGLLFGPNASVNVGSLVASTAALPDAQLNAAVSGVLVSVTPGSGAQLTVAPGAQLSANAGDLMLFGPQIQQGGAVSASGRATYAVGDSGALSFGTSATGGDARLSSFTSGGASGTPRLDHTGATTGSGGVQISVERPGSSLGRAVVNLDGVIEAKGASSDLGIDDGGSDGTGSVALTAATSTLKAGRALDVAVDTAILGSVVAGSYSVLTTGDLVQWGTASASADASLVSTGGAVTINGAVSAGADLNLYSGSDLTVAAGLSAGGSASLYAQRDLTIGAVTVSAGVDGAAVVAGRNLNADSASMISSSGGSVIAVAGAAGSGDATLGGLSGSFVLASAIGNGGQGGALAIEGPLTSTGDALLQSAGAGQANHAGVSIDGAVTASGAFEVDSSAVITVNGAVAANTVALTATSAIIASAGSTITGGLAAAGTSGFVTTVSDNPAVRLDAASFNLRGSVSAGAGDLVIQLEQAGLVGDRSGAASLLDNASFATLTAGKIYLLGAAGQTLALGDLGLDGSRIGGLWVGVDPTTGLSVTGSVTGSNGAPGLTLGFVRSLGGTTQSMVPTSLVISGRLLGLGDLRLASGGDILIGTSAFVTAAADSKFSPETQSNAYAAGLTPGQVLVQAARLQIAAGGRVLQQNTGLGSGFGGLAVGAPTAATPMFVALAEAGITAPTRISLFGALTGAAGSGVELAGTPDLLASGFTVSSDYFINGCAFGQAANCASTTVVTIFPPPTIVIKSIPTFPPPPPPAPPPISDDDPATVEAAQSATTVASAAASPPNFFFAPRLSRRRDDPNGILAPSAGRGNEELWSPTGRAQ